MPVKTIAWPARVDHVGDLIAAVEADAGDEARERARHVLERVVVVVAHDHPPRVAQAAARASDAWHLDGLGHVQKDKARGATVQLTA